MLRLLDVSISVQRAASIIAATLIALASGTNYAYSAWSPQFAHTMHLSFTQINVIGTSANLGMYATGAFTGKFTDARGPRPSGFIGAVCIGVGYFPLARAYANGPGSMNMFCLCFFSFLTGVGGCVAFQASLKTAATNFPRHRGTATAFPLAAYGLSAFFFSSIAAIAFHDDTGSFLMLLALAPGTIALLSTFFVRTLPASSAPSHSSSSTAGAAAYRSVPSGDRDRPQHQHASRLSVSAGPGVAYGYSEPGTQDRTIITTASTPSHPHADAAAAPPSRGGSGGDETGDPTTMAIIVGTTVTITSTPLTAMAGNATGTPSPTTTAGKLPTHDRGRGHGSENVPHHPGRHSRHASLNDAYSDSPTHAYAYAHARTTPSAGDSPTISAPATADETAMVVDETSSLMSGRSSTCSHDSDDLPPTASHHHSLYADVRGWELLPKIEFWQLVALLGLLSGIGLMTINNIGNDVKSLWLHWDRDATPGFIQKQQVLQVSILSIFSCGGRLLSGIGSDILVNKLHLSRVWCLFASSLIFCFAQVAATQIVNPHHLMIISSTTGLAYGFLFGVAPSIVAHVFGVGGLSQNWGILCLAPVLSGNVFNLMYGSIYDHHSIIGPTGERVCLEGVGCYRATYEFAVLVGCAGAAVSLWTIWHERRLVQRLHGGKERD